MGFLSDFDQHLVIFLSVLAGFVAVSALQIKPVKKDLTELAQRVAKIEVSTDEWYKRDHVPRAEYERTQKIASRDHEQIIINTGRLDRLEEDFRRHKEKGGEVES